MAERKPIIQFLRRHNIEMPKAALYIDQIQQRPSLHNHARTQDIMKLKMPDRKFIGGFAAGILWGVAMTFIAGTIYLRHSLVLEYECKADVAATVARVMENATRLPSWQVQQVPCAIPMASDGSKIASLRLCNKDYARQLVEKPSDRRISAAIPCALSIYEKPDGKTYMARMNMPLLGRILGGVPAQLFPETIAPEQSYLLAGALKSK